MTFLSLTAAQESLLSGAFFGDVFPLMAEEDRPELREWFVRTAGLPNLAARTPRPVTTPELSLREISGRAFKGDPYMSLEPCHKCGCQQFIPGPCPTCANCGESSKGCS